MLYLADISSVTKNYFRTFHLFLWHLFVITTRLSVCWASADYCGMQCGASGDPS